MRLLKDISRHHVGIPVYVDKDECMATVANDEKPCRIMSGQANFWNREADGTETGQWT